jgi:hypothetical protein
MLEDGHTVDSKGLANFVESGREPVFGHIAPDESKRIGLSSREVLGWTHRSSYRKAISSRVTRTRLCPKTTRLRRILGMSIGSMGFSRNMLGEQRPNGRIVGECSGSARGIFGKSLGTVWVDP